jgi:serine/threonine-protein kinase
MVSYSVHEPVDLNDGGTPPHLNTTLSGRYGVQTLLGVGRTSRVYKARVFPSGEQVAVKVLREHCNTKEDLERLKWEGEVLASLDSAYFARPIDFGVSNRETYLVTESVAGHTLAKIIKDFGRLSLLDALDVGIQLTEALQCLHDNRIIHGSFNTTDIMLERCQKRYLIKLVDLDSTVAIESSGLQQLPVFGEGCSFDYMSPEQASGEGVDEQTDIYVFGLVFYEMLCGRRPFYGASPFELLNARFSTRPESVSAIVGGIEHGDVLDEIVSMTLAADRRNRFHNIGEVRQMLISLWTALTGERYVNPRHLDTTSGAMLEETCWSSKKSFLENVAGLFRRKSN